MRPSCCRTAGSPRSSPSSPTSRGAPGMSASRATGCSIASTGDRTTSMRLHYARLAEAPDAEPRQPLPEVRLRVDPAHAAATRARLGITGRYAVLCPGAEYGPAKRWPYFPELARRLGLPIVVLGSPNDAEAAAGIGGTNLVGKTTLDEAIGHHRRRRARGEQRFRADARRRGARPAAGCAVRLLQPGADAAAVGSLRACSGSRSSAARASSASARSGISAACARCRWTGC